MLGSYRIQCMVPWVMGWSDFCPWKTLLSLGSLDQECVQVSFVVSHYFTYKWVSWWWLSQNPVSLKGGIKNLLQLFRLLLYLFLFLSGTGRHGVFSSYTCRGKVHAVNSNAEVFPPLTSLSAFYSVMKGQMKRRRKSSSCLQVIDFTLSPQSQMGLKNIAWKDSQSLGF